MRAVSAIYAQPWAITESALKIMLEIASRENISVEAVEAQLGKPLDNTHTVTVRDGIATIPVEGPLFRFASLFTEISGATSIEVLAQDLNSALDDSKVKGIVLYVDSPGGEVNGTSEFADMVYAAREQKPIVAYVSDQACSAAYWIASAASEVVIADTALVGSIGVVAAVRDPNSTRSKDIEFVSSQSPNKRPDPTTKEGKAQIQSVVDDLADVFVGSVARNRDISTDTVLEDFGQGGVFVGQKAIDAGLADRIGSYESVLAELAAPVSEPWRTLPAASWDTPATTTALADIRPIGIPVGRPASVAASRAALDTCTRPSASHGASHGAACTPASMSTNQPTRRARMGNLLDWIKGKAEEDGIQLDDTELQAAFSAPAAPDLSAVDTRLAEKDAEIAALKAAQDAQAAEAARFSAEMARMAAERLHAEAVSFAQGLVAAHRITPAAAETLVPLAERIFAADSTATFADGVKPTAALMSEFVASLPDLSVFTTSQIASDQAQALFAQFKTPGLDGTEQAPSDERLAELLAMYPSGKAAAASMKNNGTK